MNNEIRHWSEDSFWEDALENYYKIREQGKKTITLDIECMEEFIFSDKTPAYKLMDAMRSVYELEGDHGFRGAPRLILALMSILQESKEIEK